jgi:hypothetical protein
MEAPSKTSKPYAGMMNNPKAKGKRQKSACTTITVAGDNTTGGVLAAVNKLTKLVERHPRFNLELERMSFCCRTEVC